MQGNKELQINWSVPSFINICVDEWKEQEFSGYFIHKYEMDKKIFTHALDMVVQIEKLLEEINYPQATTHRRSFKKVEATLTPNVQMQEVWSGQEVGTYRGRLATFYIIIRGRANATWQGEMIWVEQNVKKKFRSVMELLAFMDNAIN